MGTTIHIANLQGKLYCSSKGYPGMLIMVEDGSRPENACPDCVKKAAFKLVFSDLVGIEEPEKGTDIFDEPGPGMSI